jgi:ABC-type branched-subunit amino acid transport system substrate-binding protein
MRSKLSRILLLVVGLLLVGTSALAGCGGTAAEGQVVVGFLGDFTGPSAATCDELKKGMDDYLKIMKETDPVPGVEIRVITFDSRLDYGRVKPGYLELRNRGSNIILNYNSMYTVQIWEDHQRDKLPSFCFNTMPEVMGKDYMFSFSNDYETEAESIGEWLVKDWWEIREETRPIKVGYIATLGLRSDTEFGNVLQAQANASPDKMQFTWTAVPQGQSSGFVTEINKLKGSDVIVVNVVGPTMASFLKEARDRGYTGEYFGSTISFMGFWNLVRASITDLSSVDGARAIHAQMLWTDETSFVDEIRASLNRFHTGATLDKLSSSTSYPSGYMFMMILVELVRAAAEKVGPENVDNEALWEAAKEIEIDVPGWGEKFNLDEETNIMHRHFRIIEFRHESNDWFQVEDGGWFLPSLFN